MRAKAKTVETTTTTTDYVIDGEDLAELIAAKLGVTGGNGRLYAIPKLAADADEELDVDLEHGSSVRIVYRYEKGTSSEEESDVGEPVRKRGR